MEQSQLQTTSDGEDSDEEDENKKEEKDKVKMEEIEEEGIVGKLQSAVKVEHTNLL